MLFDEAQAGDLATSAEGREAAWGSVRLENPEKPGAYVYALKPEVRAKYQLSEQAAEVYSQVRDFYARALDEMQKVGVYEIARDNFDEMTAQVVHNMTVQGGTLQELRTFIRQRIEATGMRLSSPEKVKRVETLLGEMEREFGVMAQKPYTPYPRFGQYAIIVREDGRW